MYRYHSFLRTVSPDELPGRRPSRQALRKCSCGRVSYLDLPCAACGGELAQTLEKTWVRNMRQFARRRCLELFLCVLAVGILLALFFWNAALLVLGLIAAILAAAVGLLPIIDRQRSFSDFWLLHNEDELRQPVGGASLEPLTDAYFLDLSRLEWIAERVCARGDRASVRRLLLYADQLSYAFNNPRLARLQMKLLLAVPGTEEMGLDLDLICSQLRADDIPEGKRWDLYAYLGEALRGGRLLESRHVKLLFEETAEALMEARKKLSLHPLPAGGALWPRLRSLCGDAVFSRAFGNLSSEELNKMRLPAEAEKMRLLADEIVRFASEHHEALRKSDRWAELVHCLRSSGDLALIEASQSVLSGFCGDPGHAEFLSFSDLYLRIEARTVASCEKSFAALFLPEEQRFTADVLSRCVFDADGLLYSEAARFGIRDLLYAYGAAYLPGLERAWQNAACFSKEAQPCSK